jgi:TolB-like protein/DNA-binding winged helix-turn-helix (wHTH) protein/Tfp pilus assembly protein PilF
VQLESLAQRSHRYTFRGFEFDPQTGELRDKQRLTVLQQQPAEILLAMLERPGGLITREELVRRLWPTGTFVDFDRSLNKAVNKLREALQDSAESPQFIETLPRRGYRFIAPVETEISEALGSTEMRFGASISSTIPSGAQVAPRGYGTRTKVVASALVVAVGLLLTLSLSPVRERLLGRRSPPRIQSLAVLPLVNLSSDVGQDYFTDGMTEALTTDLGKISALRVISRTSAMQYKGTKKPLREIAQELNVDAVIEGTVARSGSHLRITMNLVQASPERHLWAESYESEVGDALTVQGEISQAVARGVQVRLTPEEQRLLGDARTVDPEAHDDYLKGRYFWNKETRQGTERAIQYFQQAIQKSPNDPLAYAGLADCYVELNWDVLDYPDRFIPKARDAAQRALQLDQNLAEAHNSLAAVELLYDWNWSGAEKEFKHAIEVNPNYAIAHAWYAQYLWAMGRFDQSTSEAKRSLELDPFSESVSNYAAWTFYLARRYDISVQQSKRTLELNPDSPYGHYNLGLAYERTGRPKEAVEEFMKEERLAGRSPTEQLTALEQAYHRSGVQGYWQKRLAFGKEAIRKHFVSNMRLAMVSVRAGQPDAAFEFLEQAFANREMLIYLHDPFWDEVRSDPRFQDLVHRVGIPQ